MSISLATKGILSPLIQASTTKSAVVEVSAGTRSVEVQIVSPVVNVIVKEE